MVCVSEREPAISTETERADRSRRPSHKKTQADQIRGDRQTTEQSVRQTIEKQQSSLMANTPAEHNDVPLESASQLGMWSTRGPWQRRGRRARWRPREARAATARGHPRSARAPGRSGTRSATCQPDVRPDTCECTPCQMLKEETRDGCGYPKRSAGAREGKSCIAAWSTLRASAGAPRASSALA